MKKLAAILLSAVLLFNWYGFQPLMKWLDTRADQQMSSRLDKLQYDDATLIEIIVPTNLPYTNNWTSFERADGSFEFKGKQYNYVMRKMVDGKMIYKCIPNEEKNTISTARDEFFKFAFDFNKYADSKKQDSNKTVSFKKSFDDFTYQSSLLSVPVCKIQHPTFLLPGSGLVKGYHILPYHPPQA